MIRVSYKTILVFLDGTRFAEAALEHAVSMAKKFGAQLHLVRPVPLTPYLPPGVSYFGAVPLHPPIVASPQARKQEDLKLAEDYLRGLKDRMTREDIRCSYSARYGNRREVILEEAKARNADFIVIASHQRSGLARYLMPNTSTLVSVEANCPVLVVKGDETLSPFREEDLHHKLCKKVAPHSELLADQADLETDVVEAATPPALAMILAALAEERRHGPRLKELLGQLRFYKKGADDVRLFLSEGHSGPDLGLVAHIFHERGAKAAAALSEQIEGLSSDTAVALLAFLSPIVLADLSLLAEDESELREILNEELERVGGETQEAMDKAAEVVNSL
jgi:nucleotide-binding universal stress UspA family protein